MIKELVLATIQELPNDASMEDILEAVYIAINIEKGLEDVKNGNLISHEDVLKEIQTWTCNGHQKPYLI